MKVGSKWLVWAPANLAYGEHGSRSIPPNSALVFELELVGIQ
jgi:FKBP-type peptidyl-prolyl cis-trans isomerase